MRLISFDQEKRIFHLTNETISYLIQIEEEDILAHIYFGKKIRHYSGNYTYPRTDRSFSPNLPDAKERVFSADTVMLEFPGNSSDYRIPAVDVVFADGSDSVDFRYHSYRIVEGKPELEGLPAVYTKEDEAATLVITLKDTASELYLDLNYTIYTDRQLIARSNRLRNETAETIMVQQLASSNLDFPNQPLELIHLRGTWSNERAVVREKIQPGVKALGSVRGSSSHHQNPFAALATPDATETAGEVIGMSLVYSGNHQIAVEHDPYRQTRVTLGINPRHFSWQLTSGQDFQTPEAILVYSSEGLNQMSQTFHQLIKERLTRGQHQFSDRPILANNWEATFFDFDDDKILSIAEEAKALGVELFVLDDGWFGKRNADDSSLGDWFENEGKLQLGLKQLSEKIHGMDMQFGLWFEPEMISEASELFAAHPDWALQVPGRKKSIGRGQYVLDFSRKEVRENIYQQMKRILDEVDIDYIKWDMNRNMTEVFSSQLPKEQQGEVSHRYILGLYEFLERMTTEYPHILFESCSGGGGRFDLGMLAYMPQVWTSDNTDAISRIGIQYGTSYVYPVSTMGAHVAAVPNHQTGRITNLKTRGDVAMSGIFGYELDLTQLSEAEKMEMKAQITFYKAHRRLIQYGSFYRLKNPFEGNEGAWMFVSPDRTEAIVFYSRILAEASAPFHTLKLTGLAEEKDYLVGERIISGDELMNVGLYALPDVLGDFMTELIYLSER